jgi:SAM-dependent methyltransferase
MHLQEYRARELEQIRAEDLFRLLPKGLQSILEIGARDGFHTRQLTAHFDSVTALDLEKPAFSIERVTTVKGDVTTLQFSDNSFDCVLCAEVLEHVPDVEKAAAEICRVARHTAVIGVPFRQDTRLGRTTCSSCGGINPPYGHVNTFDERRLRSLFHAMPEAEFSYVGAGGEKTNAVSTWLMDVGGNPWGVYDQDEPCIHCGSRMERPASRSLAKKVCSAVGHRLNAAQQALFFRPAPGWVHVRFRKSRPAA